MSKNEISRKDFLKRISMVGAIGIGSSALLEACGGGKKEKASTSTTAGTADTTSKSSTMASNGSAATDPCMDLSGLTDSQKKMRTTLKYTGDSPYPDKNCSNCNFFTAPENGKSCGTCSIVPGPINAKGHCTSWVKKQA